MSRRARRLRHESRVLLEVAAAAVPAIAVALILLWTGDFRDKTRWTLSLAIVGAWVTFALVIRERLLRSAQTVANLIAALREGDFSIRGRGRASDDGYGLMVAEINALSDDLRARRLGDTEAGALLGKVLEETDVAIFAFDGSRRLRLVNRAGAALLGENAERLLGREAGWLGLADLLERDARRTVALGFVRGGPWELRRSPFRAGGRPHTLIVLADVARVMREEERQAWKRLVRVLSHEINNSLAPISSIAGNLRSSLDRPDRADDWHDDASRGLAIVERRAKALKRFMTSYARLARLPPPEKVSVNLGVLVERVAALEVSRAVELVGGPEVVVDADPAQLEQVLINLIKNAVDAAGETDGAVEIGWSVAPGRVELRVVDEGPGLVDTANLFVPFFTTKQGGSGIGLALSRQIADAHGGSLTLENRRDRRGCEARLSLPLAARAGDRPHLGSGVPRSEQTRRPITGFRDHEAGPMPAHSDSDP